MMANSLKRRLLVTWEKIFHQTAHLQEIDPDQKHLFYIAKRRYFGRRFIVDGIEIRKFDKVVELHMNNDIIAEIVNQELEVVAIAIRILQEGRKSMPALARALTDPKYEGVKALYGVTLINRGLSRFGFTVYPLRGKFTVRVTKWHLKNVFELINPAAKRLFLQHPESFEPKLVAASLAHFIEVNLKGPTMQSKRGI